MKMAKPRCGNKDFDLQFSSSKFLRFKTNDYSKKRIDLLKAQIKKILLIILKSLQPKIIKRLNYIQIELLLKLHIKKQKMEKLIPCLPTLGTYSDEDIW
jgi:hypothetical protein